MKKDIITILNLTAEDGSVVTAGAYIAIEIEFPIHYGGYVSRAQVYRNKEVFENGYMPVRIMDFEDEWRKETTEDINILTIYDETVAFINEQFENPVCEIVN